MARGGGAAATRFSCLGRMLRGWLGGRRRGRCGGNGTGDGVAPDLAWALARLPLFAREVWLLAARDGLGDAAIGERLGIGETEVRVYLARALANLAEALDEDGRAR